MAFNPFTWFRKHQKVIFAGLTLLVMFVFIGSFGRGDLFDWLARSFGPRASGETVATLYGKKIRESELERIRANRKLANNFLFSLALENHVERCKKLLDGELKETEAGNPLSGLRDIVSKAEDRYKRTGLSNRRSEIQRALRELDAYAARDEVSNNPERLKLIRDVATILGFQYWLAGDRQIRELQLYLQSAAVGNRNRVYPSSLYFGGGTEPEEILDFYLWKHQAEKLGIQLAYQDLLNELNNEAAGMKVFEPNSVFENHPAVIRFMQMQSSIYTTNDLLDGLRDEFRVAMAQSILLGAESGARAYRQALGASYSPALATPDEFYQFFRDHRTTLRVKMLTIPVSSFFDQVQSKPTEEELITRYNRFKDQEPHPYSRDPGFKDPRRIQVEYVHVSPSDPYYQEAAQAKLGLWAAGVVTSGKPFEAAISVLSDPLRREYELDRTAGDSDWFTNSRADLLAMEEREKKLHYTSVMRPDVVTATLAGQSTGSAIKALTNLYAVATWHEVKASAKFTFTHLLASAEPSNLFANATLIAAALPEPPSYKLMEPQIRKSVLDKLARDEMSKNLMNARQELLKLRSKPKEAKELLVKAAKQQQFQYHAMPEPMTRDEIIAALKKGKDIGLQPLQEAFKKSFFTRMERPEEMVMVLFDERGGTYSPQPLPVMDGTREEQFLFWRTRDIESRPREFSKVRAEVEQAWKLQQARKLAIQTAEKLEEQINKSNKSKEDAVAFLQQQKFGPLFELDDIARLNPPREVHALPQTEYRPYQVPEDKQSFLEYPPSDMAKQLMTLTRPGQATVIVDQPGRNVYVAVLLERTEPTLQDFKRIYSRTPENDSLYSLFLMQRRSDYVQSVLEQMRREAVNNAPDALTREGRFRIPESIRREGIYRDEES